MKKYLLLILSIILIVSWACSKSVSTTSKPRKNKYMVYYEKGRQHFLNFSKKHAKIAVNYFNKSLKLKPGFIKALAAKSEALSYLAFQKERNGMDSSEEFRLAKQNAVKAIKKNAKLGISHRALAWYFFTAGLYSFAASSAQKALKINPDDGEAAFVMWVAKEKKNINSPYLKKSLKSNYILALLNAGSIMRRKKNYIKALDYFKRVIKLVPGHIHARVNMGNVYLKMNEYEKAQEYYESAMKIAPQDSYIIFNYAASFVSMQKYGLAKKYYKKAVDINKNFIYAHLMLMRLYKKVFKNPEKYKHHKRIVLKLKKRNAQRFAKRIQEAKNIGL